MILFIVGYLLSIEFVLIMDSFLYNRGKYDLFV